jgi:hypothetical protein
MILGNALMLGVAVFAVDVEATGLKHYQPSANHRVEKTINRGWVFNYFPAENADAAGCEAPAFDDSAWPAVAIPHTWQTYETTGKIHPYIYDANEKNDPYWWHGWGWYRKHFSVGKEQSGRRVYAEFDAVQKYCKVWVNGKLVGDHKGGYDGFYFDITDFVRPGADNVLSVAVSSRQEDQFKIPPMSAGNWNTYGGIYRDARIVIKDPLHIPFQSSYKHEGGTFVTTPNVSEASGDVRVKTWVENNYSTPKECELRTTIADADGNVLQVLTAKKNIQPGELAEFDQTSQPVASPHLWSPESPYVYRVFSDVCTGGAVVDHFESPLGFRWFKWDYSQDRLILNGKKFIIHGSNHHQEWPWLCDATPKWMLLEDMKDFRLNLNNNFMRTAHYPNDPCIYDFNDRHGIVTIEELPNDKRQQFNEAVQIQQLRETIRRDRNHPSIFFWSMGNETDHAVDSKYALEEDTTRLIHARDIYNESAGKFVNTVSKNIALESLLRCTIRGWYNSDVRDLEPQSSQQTGTETWQHDQAAAEIIKRNEGRTPDDRASINTWLYEDHGCNRQYVNCPLDYINPKGWVDSWRVPKYMYYLWQAFYAEKPMVFIHPHFWRSQYVGQKKEIVVDSNCETVGLKVNGRSIGVLKPAFAQANVVRFKNVPIEQGVLTAEGKKNGVTVTNTVVMAGEPARVTLSANPATLPAGMDSLAIVRADIVDAQGNHVMDATNTIYWSVSGPATLVGALVYQTDTDKNEANEGTMYIVAPTFNIIRSSGKPGEIKVHAYSRGIAAGDVSITATAVPENTTAVIEPPLPEGKRQAVAREDAAASQDDLGSQKLHGTTDDVFFTASSLEEYTRQIDGFLREKNPVLGFDTPEYRALVSVFAGLLQKNNGSLIRDDYNFTAGFYNNCRRITRQIAALKLPEPFKQSLREYYAQTMIQRGEAKDYNNEARWLASLPEGKPVVAGVPAGAVHDAGVLYADKPDFQAMVALALPELNNLDDARKAAMLETVCALNPMVKKTVVKSGGGKVDGVRQKTKKTISYEVAKGQAILVPSLQYLENAGRSQKKQKQTNPDV